MMKPKALLFDLDGTLVDTAPDLCGTIIDMQKDRHLPLTPFEDMEHLASGGARALLYKGFGLTPQSDEFQSMRREFLERYESRIAQESRCYPGIDKLLEQAERLGLRWAIVTNKPAYLAEQLVKALDLDSRCATLIGGDTASAPKPDPSPCLLAAERIGLAPNHCLMIGDDERDIVSGRAAGMTTAAVSYGYIASPIEAWNADFVFDSPEQIRHWLTKA